MVKNSLRLDGGRWLMAPGRWRALCGLLLALAAMHGGVAAAGADEAGDAAGGGSDVVRFVAAELPNPAQTNANAVAQRRVLRAFLKENPDVRIEPFEMPKITGASMDSGPLMGIASGQPPHAIYVNFRQSASYINHGFLAPMEVLLARLQSDDPRTRRTDDRGNWLADPGEDAIADAKAQLRARVVDRVWPVVNRRADVDKRGIPQGEHVWSLPTATLVRAMLYRKDVFQQAGLDPEDPPETWDELVEVTRKINALDGKVGMLLDGGTNVSWSVYSFMVSNGVRYMARNEDGEWEATFGTDAAAESIYYLMRLASASYDLDGETYRGPALIESNKPRLDQMWDRGNAGIQFSYLEQDRIADVNPELIGIAPVPYPQGGAPAGELNCRMLGVFAGSTPRQRLAVMRYIWFVTSEEAQRITVDTMVEFGLGKFLNPDLLRRFGYEDILRQIPAGWRETFQTAIHNGVPEPYGRNTQFIYSKVSEPINWALANADTLLSYTPDEAKQRIQARLTEAASRYNRFTLERLTPEEWQTRRIVGGTSLAAVLLAFVAAIVYVWRAFTKADAAKGSGKQRRYRKFWKAYMLMLPALALVVFWQYGPLILGMPLALFDYELVVESTWVGIDNFATVLYDERFWKSLGNTLYYVLLVVGLGFWPPIMIAILLDEVPTATLKYFFRTVFYLPQVMAGVIVVFLWLQFYQADEDGFLNQLIMSVNGLGPVAGTLMKWLLLGAWLSLIGTVMMFAVKLREMSMLMRGIVFVFGLALLGVTLVPLVEAYLGPGALELGAMQRQAEQAGQAFNAEAHRGWSAVLASLSNLVGAWDVEPLKWVDDPQLAMVCVVIPMVWVTSGPGCIIYLAALKTVPNELVEAATVDGAGIMQKIAYITLPRIKFLILIQLVGATVAAFKGGTNFILAMTGGGPQGATRVLGMDIFERTFMELQYGIGAAMAWLLGALVIALTAFQLKRLSKAEFRTADTTPAPAGAPAAGGAAAGGPTAPTAAQ